MRNLTTLLALIPLALCAQTYYYITGIDVSPASPTDQDAITLTLHGDLSSSGAYIVSSSAQVFGGVLQIDVTADDPGGLAILVPHADFRFVIRHLPAKMTLQGFLYPNLVACKNADVVFTHFAGDVRGYNVTVFQLNPKSGVGQGIDYLAFHFDLVFFCHYLATLMKKQSRILPESGR